MLLTTNWTWKDAQLWHCGSGSHLIRAFTGTKLLQTALFTASAHTGAQAPILGDGWVTNRCYMQPDSLSDPHTSHSLGSKLCHTPLPFNHPLLSICCAPHNSFQHHSPLPLPPPPPPTLHLGTSHMPLHESSLCLLTPPC